MANRHFINCIFLQPSRLLVMMELYWLLVLDLVQSSLADNSIGRRWNLQQTYMSSKAVSLHFDVLSQQQGYEDDLYTFLAPYGFKVTRAGPMIVDNHGSLIWTTDAFDGVAMNFKMQLYKGKQYLTFWSGYNKIQGHGRGQYYMLDSTYRVKEFGAKNGLEGDLHEFSITESGTALITIYQAISVDFSKVHARWETGYIWDCIFQEIALEDDTLIFEWRASDHFSLDTSFQKVNEGSRDLPWDWCHINSVEKDDLGNYLVSFRNFHSIAYIAGSSGKVLWQLGGRYNNFTDRSDGRATNFAFQHHARWAGKDTITMFDNAVNYDNRDRALYSRGLHIALDLSKKTVEVIKEYINPVHLRALTQGTMQVLPNGNVLLGFGDIPTFTEFAPSGDVVYATKFGPISSPPVGNENVQSYGVFKYPWKGYPETQPDIAVRAKFVYVSWNGATEVRQWCLHDAEQQLDKYSVAEDLPWRKVGCYAKNGFETAIPFNEVETKKYVRVVALDSDGQVLGNTRTVDWAKEKVSSPYNERSLCQRLAHIQNQQRFARLLDSVHPQMPHIPLYSIAILVMVVISLVLLCKRASYRPRRKIV